MDKYTLKYLVASICGILFLILLLGCNDVDCHPDGKLENKKGDFYIGVKCGGKF